MCLPTRSERMFQALREFFRISSVLRAAFGSCGRGNRCTGLCNIIDDDDHEIGQGTPRTGLGLHHTLTQLKRGGRELDTTIGGPAPPLERAQTEVSQSGDGPLGSSLARRLDFSRQTARFRDWNAPFSTLFGLGNSYATDATRTLRITKLRGGTDPTDGVSPVRLSTLTPAGRKQRDKTCLGKEGVRTKIPVTRPLLHTARNHLEPTRLINRSSCVPRLV